MKNFELVPSVPLNTLKERDLVERAIREIYQASNGRLNDFSSASAIRALIEGQIFAQSEFLSFLDRFPNKVILEWLVTVLGIQRKLGSPSTTTLRVELTRKIPTQFVLPKGFLVRTTFGIGLDISFSTTERLIIPPNSRTGFVQANSTSLGTKANVPANSIGKFEESLAFLKSINNDSPAIGGRDEESIIELKKRAYSLMTRRLPVSFNDWKNFLEDLIGDELILKMKSPSANELTFFLADKNKDPLPQETKDFLRERIKKNVQLPIEVFLDDLEKQKIDFKIFSSEKREKIVEKIDTLLSQRGVDDYLRNQDLIIALPEASQITAYASPEKIDSRLAKKWFSEGTYKENELISTTSGEFFKVEQNFSPRGGLLPRNYPDLYYQRARRYERNTFYRADEIILDDTYGAYYVTNDVISTEDFGLDITVPGSSFRPLRILDTIPDLSTNPVEEVGKLVSDGPDYKIYYDSDWRLVNTVKELVPWTYSIGDSFSKGSIIFPNYQNFSSFNSASFQQEVKEKSIFDSEYQFFVAEESVNIEDSVSIQSAVSQGLISEVLIIKENTVGETYFVGDYIISKGEYFLALQDFISSGDLIDDSRTEKVSLFLARNDRLLINRFNPRFLAGDYVSVGNKVYQALKSFTPKREETAEKLINTGKLATTPYSTQRTKGPLKLLSPLTNQGIAIPGNLKLNFEDNGDEFELNFYLRQFNSIEIKNSNVYSQLDLPIRFEFPRTYEVDDTKYVFNKDIVFFANSLDSEGKIRSVVFPPFGLPKFSEEYKTAMISSLTNNGGRGGKVILRAIENSPGVYLVNVSEIYEGGDFYKPGEVVRAFAFGESFDYEVRKIEREEFPLFYRPLREIERRKEFLINHDEYISKIGFSPLELNYEAYRNSKWTEPTGNSYRSNPEDIPFIRKYKNSNELPAKQISKTYFGSGNNPNAAFDEQLSSSWETFISGAQILENEFAGIDFGKPVIIDAAKIVQSELSNKRAGFKIQVSNYESSSWGTVIDSSSTTEVQDFRFPKILARYVRILAANEAPLDTWEVKNVDLSFEEFSDPLFFLGKYEDVVEYKKEFYRVMKQFSAIDGDDIKSYERDGKLLKIVEEYSCQENIKPVNDFNLLILGEVVINGNFSTNKQGEVFSTFPDYSGGTVLL